MKIEFDLKGKAASGIAKTKKVADLFVKGFKKEAGSDWNMGLSTAAGLWQGLKYKGSVKKGLQAGLGTYISLNAVNGVSNVINNWDEVKKTV